VFVVHVGSLTRTVLGDEEGRYTAAAVLVVYL
jgi:hypothetical protein